MSYFGRKPVKDRPNLKIWWKENLGYRTKYSIEIFDKELQCECCGKYGSYYLEEEQYNRVGLCPKHLNRANDWIRLEPL